MKKRFILAALIFAGLTGLTASCEILDKCGKCELVTIDANNNETRTNPGPFCGEDLKSKKDASPETIGDITTYWECY
jgi:hypothetical protein